MMRLFLCSIAGLWLLFLPAPAALAGTQAQAHPRHTSGAVHLATPVFHVLRSVVGANGEMKNGEYVVEDVRNVFHLPGDKKVIVYFEWQGPAGAHHFVGTWLDPQGKEASTSTFDYYSPGKVFSGFWIFELNNTLPAGLWVLQAQIDGQPAGERTFRIVSNLPPPPPPRPSVPEVYQKVQAASVYIKRLGPDHNSLGTGSGFFIAPGVVLTAFQAVDAADSLRIVLPDGSSRVTDKLLGWNRARGWALLSVPGTSAVPLEFAKPGSWKVGDTCYSIGSPSAGVRSIQPVGITGLVQPNGDGERFSISWSGPAEALGTPVLDLYGRVIGLLAGGVIPPMNAGNLHLVSGELIGSTAPLAAPVALLPSAAPTTTPATLGELRARGVLMAPLVRDSQILEGFLCKNYTVERTAFVPGEITDDYYHDQKSFSVLMTWAATEKQQSTDQLLIYNAKNQLVVRSAVKKIRLVPHVSANTAWNIPLSVLAPGIYRADVLLGTDVEWRHWFRVHP